jgi:hypothetical protein
MDPSVLSWEDWDSSDEEKEEQEEKEEKEEQEANHIIIPLTSAIIESLLGHIAPSIEYEPPLSEVDTEDSDEECYTLRRRCPFEESPPSKRLRWKEESYYFKLTSGEEFYYTESDAKPMLLDERLEPNPIVRIIIGNMPRSIKERLTYLSKFRYEEEPEEEDLDSDEDEPTMKPRQFDDVCEQVFSAYVREMKLRTIFRSVLARWRVYRLDKQKQDVDPITLSPPEKIVALYEPNKKYIFDAASLATWIESKLHYHEYGFALPMFPRNPWTNLDFTYSQMISIYYQLKAHGELRWGLTTLRTHDFNKKSWQLYHKSALTLKAIRNNLFLLDTIDAWELLEDFIFAKMEELRVRTNPYITNAYRMAMRHDPSDWYMEKWKAIAFMHLEAEHFGQNKLIAINMACAALFKKQELFLKRMIQKGII